MEQYVRHIKCVFAGRVTARVAAVDCATPCYLADNTSMKKLTLRQRETVK